MSEFCFDVDSLGTLTLEHFEQDYDQRSEGHSPTLSEDFIASPLSSPPPNVSSPHSLGSSCDCGSTLSISSDEGASGEDLNQGDARRSRGRPGKTVTSKRNERERKRVKSISNGFSTLRKRVFGPQTNNRLPKLHILRSAIEYIRSMEQLLAENDRRLALETQGRGLMQGYRPNVKTYAPMVIAKLQKRSSCSHWNPEMDYIESYQCDDPNVVTQCITPPSRPCDRRVASGPNPNIAQ